MTAILLIAATLFPALVCAGIFLLNKRAAFGKLPYAPKQALIGLAFGLCVALSTEYGVDIGGAIMNVRDAAPLCAGLAFGAPAGVIAGVIGGAHRWLAVYWSGGEYTRAACSIATIVAGLFGAAMRKYMFDDKRASWAGGLMAGLTAEVIHMLLIFITNMSDIQYAFTFVIKTAPVMIPLNSLSVMLSMYIMSKLDKQARRSRARIAYLFQCRLLICVALALGVTVYFTFSLQTRITRERTNSLLKQGLSSVPRDMDEITNNTIHMYTGWIALDIDSHAAPDIEFINALIGEYEVPEIFVADENGVITLCNIPSISGYDLSANTRAAEYLTLLDEPERVWDYLPSFHDPSVYRKYSGAALERGGFVLVGYDEAFMRDETARRIQTAAKNRHVGQDGRLLIIGADGVIISDSYGCAGMPIKHIGLELSALEYNAAFRANVYGVDSYCMATNMSTLAGDYIVVALLPVNEARFYQNITVYITVFMEVVIYAELFILIYSLVKRLVVKNIREVNGALARITDGDLDVAVNVRRSDEFEALSDGINATVVTLKRYISEAEARIDAELEFARQIQTSALPNVFPPYPNRTDFELYACMRPAKEVGGDFYDFYMLGNNTLVFLVADVSGKGIPAALFMMKAKTQLKSLAENGLSLEQVFAQANAKLCESNTVKMFLTAWMGALDISTGELTYACAGHNPPLLRRAGGEFEYLRVKNDFILAGLDGIKYTKRTITLEPGDIMFLYTDGVTEACDPSEKLFGEARLLNALNAASDTSPEALCAHIKTALDMYARTAPQSDDITMLCVKLNETRK